MSVLPRSDNSTAGNNNNNNNNYYYYYYYKGYIGIGKVVLLQEADPALVLANPGVS
jgi:hypothetical protein